MSFAVRALPSSQVNVASCTSPSSYSSSQAASKASAFTRYRKARGEISSRMRGIMPFVWSSVQALMSSSVVSSKGARNAPAL